VIFNPVWLKEKGTVCPDLKTNRNNLGRLYIVANVLYFRMGRLSIAYTSLDEIIINT